MDTAIDHSLQKLRASKQDLNKKVDLTSEYDTLVELDRRVGTVLEEVRTLHIDIDNRYEHIDDGCNKLAPSYQTLLRTSELLNIFVELTRLNRLSRQLNGVTYFANVDKNLSSTKASSGDNGNGEEYADENQDKIIKQVLNELINNFAATYEPLESILSLRPDLPYATIAARVRSLNTE